MYNVYMFISYSFKNLDFLAIRDFYQQSELSGFYKINNFTLISHFLIAQVYTHIHVYVYMYLKATINCGY